MLAMALFSASCGDGSRTSSSGGDAETAQHRDTASASQADRGEQATTTGRTSGDERVPGKISALVSQMSVDEQVGQLIMTAITSTTLTAEERRALQRQHLGGIILFRYNYSDARQMRRLTRQIVGASRSGNRPGIAALTAVDQEGGEARAFLDQPPRQSAALVAETMSPDRARELARTTGRSLRDMGITMNLAPVADLALPPRRVMAARAFGGTAQDARPFVAATVAGLQAGGVAATVKHFPGFGGTSANSDDAVAHIRRPMRVLRSVDMAVFDMRADAVMVSHGIYDGAGSRTPATIAPEWIEPELRARLGYSGVVITDSMNAAGVRAATGNNVPRTCVPAVRAGVDIVLLTGSLETSAICARRLRQAVNSGQVSRERLAQSVARILQLKQRVGLVPAPTASG